MLLKHILYFYYGILLYIYQIFVKHYVEKPENAQCYTSKTNIRYVHFYRIFGCDSGDERSIYSGVERVRLLSARTDAVPHLNGQLILLKRLIDHFLLVGFLQMR